MTTLADWGLEGFLFFFVPFVVWSFGELGGVAARRFRRTASAIGFLTALAVVAVWGEIRRDVPVSGGLTACALGLAAGLVLRHVVGKFDRPR